jgi:hypothetical protein
LVFNSAFCTAAPPALAGVFLAVDRRDMRRVFRDMDASAAESQQTGSQEQQLPAPDTPQAIAFDRDDEGHITQMRLVQQQVEYPPPRLVSLPGGLSRPLQPKTPAARDAGSPLRT